MVAVQAISDLNTTGQVVALDISSSYNKSNGLPFNVDVSQPTAAVYLPAELFNKPSVVNSTSLTHAAFLGDSLFIRRRESYLSVASVVLSSSIVGGTVEGLDPPISLTFAVNQVSLIKLLSCIMTMPV